MIEHHDAAQGRWQAGDQQTQADIEVLNSIDHFVYDDAGALISRLNRYSDAAACDAVLQGRRFRAHQTARRFFTRFYKSYCRRRGYREGWRGVLLALFSALYPVLTHLKALELAERRGRDG